MEELSEILEKDLKKAVEVRDPESLHRYVVTLSQRIVEKEPHERAHTALEREIRELTLEMKHGFALMEQRFEAERRERELGFETAKREREKGFEAAKREREIGFEAAKRERELGFEAAKQERELGFEAAKQERELGFEAARREREQGFARMEKQLSRQFRFLTLGFSLLALLIAAFNITLIISG